MQPTSTAVNLGELTVQQQGTQFHHMQFGPMLYGPESK
eukprot:CAMPEP_0194782832 /NCGR_PEP_ID=MMETSP0323_2-20130528/78899_1 /TAXON_ID=2866 ORGANISM="Crypthecodinium cohnii, Strain Seligo" /NCGR_SAMPLE_ID=MMETSP0323_2 /ASSEMBLY_ACC=CAM_ASM_000346 /LENGTH=37 /DNA_ID= /DNA_START= /DNA_END= /DNA_ORIENTATION=